MRAILLRQSDGDYLQKCSLEHKFTYGIIIGQQSEGEKFVVVHLARNGEEDSEISEASNLGSSHEVTESVGDIDSHSLLNQFISASKMIPGSFTILGVFASSASTIVHEEKSIQSAKNLLFEMNSLILRNNNISEIINNAANTETLFLSYSTSTKKAMCKAYLHSENGGIFTPVDCRLIDKPLEWFVFESNYELNDIFPILSSEKKINIEHQFSATLAEIKTNLATSEIFIQNENVDESLSLESYIKQKYGKKDNIDGTFKASIFLSVNKSSDDHPIVVREYNGTIRFSGVISSRVWCHPKNTVKEIKSFVRADIIRSLAARIQVYCDGLTDPTASSDTIVINEPPRRVYFNVPHQTIQFSEYIFRGETPTVAVAQAKQFLDLDIDCGCIYADLEGLPDDDAFNSSSSDLKVVPSGTTLSQRDISRTMYMLGISVALLVLLSSILLHFVIR